MSKYSLEAYEKVAVTCCRPVPATLQVSRGTLAVRTVLVGDTPPAASADTLLAPKLTGIGNSEVDVVAAEAFLRKLGSLTDGARGYAGVVVDDICGAHFHALLCAWIQAFDNSILLIRVPSDGCAGIVSELKRNNISFGLLLDVSDGITAVRRALAVNKLQRVWQSSPVFLLGADAPDTHDEVLRAARGWHVCAADIAGLREGQPMLRRLMRPVGLSAGGALPLRFWWTVEGDSPIYGSTRVRVLLRDNQGGEFEVVLHDCKELRSIGDSTHNVITQIPDLKPGDYELCCGMFRDDGSPIALAIAAPCTYGWYTLDTVRLDDKPRPELNTLWDDYYPEGYYPLEDPKLPY